MKTYPSIQSQKTQRKLGSALLLAVMFFVLTAIFLATYLILTRNEYNAVARSQNWNSSMVLAEAGVEDALALINQNVEGAVGTLGNWPSAAAADGWNVIVSNANYEVFYLANRTPDTTLGYYSVYITNNFSSANGPTILSIGTSYWHGNVTTLTALNGTRKILVQTSGYSQGSDGMIAFASMTFNGNNVTVDSFNSANPSNSIWQTGMLFRGMQYGIYSDSLSYNSNDPPSRTADVMVATDGNSLNVGNANIYGYLDTAPGGTSQAGANGSVGDLNWVYSGTSGIESGHARDDMNTVYHSKSLPSPVTSAQSTWWPVPVPPGGSTNIGGTSYSYYITNKPAIGANLAYYAMNSLSANMYINASNVVLYLTNGMSYSGQSTFTLNSNADVTIYTTGSVSVSGKAVIDNVADYAKAFSMYDVAGYTNLSFSFSGNGIGSAYLYVPSSSVSFNGGGSSSYGFVGCLFCNSVSVNGHYTFHFDVALNSTAAADQYLPTMWQEVH